MTATAGHTGAGVDTGAGVELTLDPQRRFGVEIECFVPSWEELVDALEREGIPAFGTRRDPHATCYCDDEDDDCYCFEVQETYDTNAPEAWELRTDCTLQGGALDPVELVSPILCSVDGARQLAAVGRALHALGAEVHDSAGLHVHHEVVDLDLAALRGLVASYEAALRPIDALLDPSRRSDNPRACNKRWGTDQARAWAAATTVADFAARSSRNVLNFSGLVWRGTVEFRQHHATVDAAAITAWVRLGQRFIAAAAAGDVVSVDAVDALTARLGCADVERTLWATRAATLATPVAA